MLLLSTQMAPLPILGDKMDGMIRTYSQETGEVSKPGKVLELFLELRKRTGVIAAKKKDGVKFKVRSAEDLIDKIRDEANDLGLLIYPGSPHQGTTGKGHVVEDGTLAEVTLTVMIQAIEDGSRLALGGFGLGADLQDKAGGKAGTYAFKQALIQALLAGGAASAKKLGVADTDDTDTPIEGGVRPKTRKKAPTADEMTKLFESLEAGDRDGYDAALKMAMTMQPAEQTKIKDVVKAASARCKGGTNATR